MGDKRDPAKTFLVTKTEINFLKKMGNGKGWHPI